MTMNKKRPSSASSDGKEQERVSSNVDGNTQMATGGELHQIASGDHAALTTNQGVVIADNQNSRRAHAKGPTLLEDFILREKIMHFDHERIPERIVHGRGTGVH